MGDDWTWMWRSDSSRTWILRGEVEGLEQDVSLVRSQSAGLSSQLRTLQGSIETRLQALSTAFDAYVELGDVREQLAGFPDSSAVRRDALRAVEELSRGAAPAPVDGRGLGYWLSDAVNELVALVTSPSGRRPASGASAPVAVSTGPERELFVVAAAGALDRGSLVGTRVVALLVGDVTLSPHQLVLWAAVRDGVYGDVLDEVSEVWSAALLQDAQTWSAWVAREANDSRPVDALRWIEGLLRGETAGTTEPVEPGPEPECGPTAVGTSGATAARSDPRLDPLRGLVRELVELGDADERALLDRARVLRARIEDPSAPVAAAREPGAAGPSVTYTVQQALRDPATPQAVRRTLLTWVRPGLLAAAAAFAQQAADAPATPLVVQTEMGELEVGVDGPDPARLAQAEAAAAQQYATSRAAVVAPLVVGAVVLLLGLVLLAGDDAGLGVLALLVAVVAAGFGLRRLAENRRHRTELAQLSERTGRRIDDARHNAQAVQRACLETQAETAVLLRQITGETAAAAPVGDLR